MTSDQLDDLTQLFRESILSHINDIAVEKGLGPPEFYYISVEEKRIINNTAEIKLKISGSTAEYGIITPLYRYITNRIGVEQWNTDIMHVINELAKKMNINFEFDIETHIDPLTFDMYMFAK